MANGRTKDGPSEKWLHLVLIENDFKFNCIFGILGGIPTIMHAVLESDNVSGRCPHPVFAMSALPLTSSGTSPKIVKRAHRPILDLIERLTAGRFSMKLFSDSPHDGYSSVASLGCPNAGRTMVVVIPRHRGRNRK